MKRRITAFTILLMLLILAIPNTVNANQVNDILNVNGGYVVIESYSITNERIIPGEPFVLTMVVKNASNMYAARNTLVDIINPSGVSPEYGKVSEFYLGDIEPGVTKTIELKYDTWTSIKSDTLDFQVIIVTDTNSHTTNLRIPSGSEEPFSVLAIDIPTNGTQGDSLSTSLTFRALGEEDIKDVAYVVRVDGEEVVCTTIGLMKPDATKNSAAAFSIADAGEHTIEILLRYSDETGKQYYMEAGQEKIVIIQGTNQQATPGGLENITRNNTEPNYIGMGALAAVIVVLFFSVVVILKKK